VTNQKPYVRGALRPRRPRRAEGGRRAEGSDAIDLEIESIAAGGDGVGRVGRLVAFVPRTAPGDAVSVRLYERAGGRFARGELLAVRRAGPNRVDPPCPHYDGDRCGGCQLQHLSYEAQLVAKGRIARDAITRIARRPVEDVQVEASPRHWRYRSKLTLEIRRQGSGSWIAGLHRFDEPDDVFSLDDCPITDARVVACWRDILRAASDLPPADRLRGSVRVTVDGFVFVLDGGTTWERAAAFRAAVPSLTEVWWRPDGGSRRLIERGQHVPGPAGASFSQVNDDVAALLRTHVVERAMSYSPESAVDAYAGSGATATALAALGVRVTAIEADRRAAAMSARSLPTGSRSISARVEDVLQSVLPADVLIVNPPRSGISGQVASVIAKVEPPPRVLLYVSCDPATLARDLSRLARYDIASLRAFDMFPQTAHVETVCELVPAAAIS